MLLAEVKFYTVSSTNLIHPIWKHWCDWDLLLPKFDAENVHFHMPISEMVDKGITRTSSGQDPDVKSLH